MKSETAKKQPRKAPSGRKAPYRPPIPFDQLIALEKAVRRAVDKSERLDEETLVQIGQALCILHNELFRQFSARQRKVSKSAEETWRAASTAYALVSEGKASRKEAILSSIPREATERERIKTERAYRKVKMAVESPNRVKPGERTQIIYSIPAIEQAEARLRRNGPSGF